MRVVVVLCLSLCNVRLTQLLLSLLNPFSYVTFRLSLSAHSSDIRVMQKHFLSLVRRTALPYQTYGTLLSLLDRRRLALPELEGSTREGKGKALSLGFFIGLSTLLVSG